MLTELRYPDHAPMRHGLERDSHAGCDICREQREGLRPPFVRAEDVRAAILADDAARYLAAVEAFRAEGCAPTWKGDR